MKEDPPKVQITITDSVVGGDVVAGNKTAVVVVSPELLKSPGAVQAALLKEGFGANAAEVLIDLLLSDPEWEKQLDEARRTRDRARLEEMLEATYREYERTGASEDMLSNLWKGVGTARGAEEWLSFSKCGVALLSIQFNNNNAGEEYDRLAAELVEVARKDPKLADNVPIARVYQAIYAYTQYGKTMMDLRATLQVAVASPAQVPLVNLLPELKKAFALAALSNEYEREALDLASKSGDPSALIFVLFGVSTLQSSKRWFEHLYLGKDGHSLGDRFLRTTQVLEKVIKAFGSETNLAILHSNVAAYWLQTGEFEKAEVLALAAAEKLTALGDAHSAKRALSILMSARKREPALRRPSEEDLDAAPVEEIMAAMRDGVATMAKMRGIDLTDPTVAANVEMGFHDFTPERVLRYCEHIAVGYHSSPLGDALGLPAIGAKSLACEKFRKQVRASDLDTGLSGLKERLGCEQCQHRSPRPDDWKFTAKWEAEQFAKRAQKSDEDH